MNSIHTVAITRDWRLKCAAKERGLQSGLRRGIELAEERAQDYKWNSQLSVIHRLS